MASSLDVMTVSRSIFESEGVEAERFIQGLKLPVRCNTRVDEMETDSSESSGDDESDEDETEENFPGLFELEALTLIIKLRLRRTQQTKQDQQKSLQDFENKLYRVLSESVEPFKKFLASKKSKDLTDLPMLQHYLEMLSEACDGLMKEKMKVNFQMHEEDRRRLHKYTVFVCSLLGLRLDFLDRLEEMPSETRDHQTLDYWIVNFLRNNNETLTRTEKNSSYKEQLYAIGFDRLSSAVETILERAGSMEQHIDACEWAERRVQDEFKYNFLLSLQNERFPFEIDGRAEWLERDGVFIANVVTKKSESSSKTQSMLGMFERLYDEQQFVLFHGTDHKSACDIMSGRGIHLEAGRTKRDFSSGAGFYLTQNLDDALSWACSTTVKPAILVFRVELDFLNKASKLDLNEGDGLTKWREIVNFFRLDRGPRNIRSSLSAYDLIEGKSAIATRSETTNGNVLMFEQNPSSYQMCLISEKFAEMFQEKLHSIFFYDIS